MTACISGAPSMGSAARLALADVLRRAGAETSLVVIHTWTRAQQGQAYLWARAFIEGREDVPPPMFMAWGLR